MEGSKFMTEKQNAIDGQVALAISGMTCDGCANTVQRVLSRTLGVDQVSVDLGAARAVVLGAAAPQALIAAVEAAGFGAALSPPR
jgi:Cu+-exporting ATPase